MTSSTAPLSVNFVCRLAWSNSLECWLTRFPCQAAGLPCVPAWSMAKTNSASNTCRIEALLSRVGVKELMTIVPFTAACSSPAMLGSCRYVELVAGRKWSHLTEASRLVHARTFAHVTALVGAPWMIALRLGAAILVRSRRSAVKSSWRRTVSKGFLNRSERLL